MATAINNRVATFPTPGWRVTLRAGRSNGSGIRAQRVCPVRIAATLFLLALATVSVLAQNRSAIPSLTNDTLLNASASSHLTEPRVKESLATIEIPFVPNESRLDPTVSYYAMTFAGTVYVTRDGRIVYSLPARAMDPAKSSQRGERSSGRAPGNGWSLTETPVGGKARVTAGQPGSARVSYFIGNDPERWRSDVSTYETVELGQVWPGVRLSLRAYGDNVEKIFTVAPGVDASRIRMRVTGARSLRVDQNGALVATTGPGDVTFTRPVAYQERDGVRRAVTVAYRAKGRQYGFSISGHDPALPLVIDPLLQATYLGGTSNDLGQALAIHPTSGDVYVYGLTFADFPGTTGGAQPAIGGSIDSFVARLNAALTTLDQATYLGGTGDEYPGSLAIHPTSGDVYVTGRTYSTDFPGTIGGAQEAIGGSSDGYVARLNAALTTLEQATYLGGGSDDGALAIAIHPTSGDVYVAGDTFSADFPGTTGGAQEANGGSDDAFVARLSVALTTLVQATYLGGTDLDDARALVIYPTSGDVYVTGTTYSTDFPGTTEGAQDAIGGAADAFVARSNAALTTLHQATYLGGTNFDYVQYASACLAIHPTSGDVYVTGVTNSADFPARPEERRMPLGESPTLSSRV